LEGFKKITTEEYVKKIYGSIPQWRHNFVYERVGSLYSCGGSGIN